MEKQKWTNKVTVWTGPVGKRSRGRRLTIDKDLHKFIL